MRAFIAGATGYTGRELVRVLRERGATVTAHVRPDSPRLGEWQARLGALGAQADATPWQPDALRATLARVQPTHVFALLGTTRRRARGEGLSAAAGYERIDYGLTALLLRATTEAAPQARFIYLSAIGASARGNAYLRARARLEHELRGSGLSWISARPALITGSDREEHRAGERAAAAVLDGVLQVLRRLGLRGTAERWRSITAADLAAALAQLAERHPDGIYEADAVRRAAAYAAARAASD
jgi:nucleoside-diphosphate-sugar epimerase